MSPTSELAPGDLRDLILRGTNMCVVYVCFNFVFGKTLFHLAGFIVCVANERPRELGNTLRGEASPSPNLSLIHI